MRDKKRIAELLSLLEILWNKSPDQRFGQLLINNWIASDDNATWNREDDVLIKHLEERLKKGENGKKSS